MGSTTAQLLNANRAKRKQKGQRIETPSAFFLRYYVNTTDENGAAVRKQECVKIADKSDVYRSWNDIELLVQSELERMNSGADIATGNISMTGYIEKDYLPWCEEKNEQGVSQQIACAHERI